MNAALEIWSTVLDRPLFGLWLTLAVYCVACRVYDVSGHCLLNPVLTAGIVLGVFLYVTGYDYRAYLEGAALLQVLLGPFVVLLAIPLYVVTQRLGPCVALGLIPIACGGVMAVLSVALLAWLLGAPHDLVLGLMPKSATTPVAMGIAEEIGGSISLTVALVVLTGVLASTIAFPLLNLLGVRDPKARGLAIGVAGHAIGTALAVRQDATAGAFAALAMGVNAVLTAALIPFILRWLG